MTPTEAAKIYRTQKRFFDDPKIKARRRQLEAAEKVLKTYFAEQPKKGRFQGVVCTRSPYTYFDAPSARVSLGAKAAVFEEERTRMSLGIAP